MKKQRLTPSVQQRLTILINIWVVFLVLALSVSTFPVLADAVDTPTPGITSIDATPTETPSSVGTPTVFPTASPTAFFTSTPTLLLSPAITGTPVSYSWHLTPRDANALASDTPLVLLAGELIFHGLVDASACPYGGLMENRNANTCGLQVAHNAVILWQNQFDEDIYKEARRLDIPPFVLKNVIMRESQFWPQSYATIYGYSEVGLGRVTEMGADTALRWNPDFAKSFCKTVYTDDTCKKSYSLMPLSQQYVLRGAVVRALNADCSTCPGGIDLKKARASISIIAETLNANRAYVENKLFDGLFSRQRETLVWRFALASYNAGPGCLTTAVSRTHINGDPLDWKNVSGRLDPGCNGAVAYVEFVTNVDPTNMSEVARASSDTSLAAQMVLSFSPQLALTATSIAPTATVSLATVAPAGTPTPVIPLTPVSTYEATVSPLPDLPTGTPVPATVEGTPTSTPDLTGTPAIPTVTATQPPPAESPTETFVPGEILVKFNGFPSTMFESSVLSSVDANIKSENDSLGTMVIQVPPEQMPAALAELQNSMHVAYAEPNYTMQAFYTPNDPGYINQTYLSQMQVPAAWDTTKGENVVVAVIDTGMDITHPDLTMGLWGNVGEAGLDANGKDRATNGIDDDGNGYVDDLTGWNFVGNNTNVLDDNGHGTHVAGIIAARMDNNLGIAGIAPLSKVMVLKALDANGQGSYANAASAIVYAVDNGAQIINLGFGGSANSEALRAATDYAYDHGVVVVAAGGNTGDQTVIYPAANPNVIAVSALNPDLTIASFSTFGNASNISAPGVGIYSTTLRGNYAALSGTSMSSAQISGVAALLVSQPQFNTPDKVRAAIANTALDLGNPGADLYYGVGLVRALDALTGTASVYVTPTPGGQVITPTPVANPTEVLTIQAVAALNQWAAAAVYNGAANPSTNTPFNYSTGSSRLLVVVVNYETSAIGAHTLNVTYGGTALTPVLNQVSQRQCIWVGYLLENQLPASGSNLQSTITLAGGATLTRQTIHAAVYSGVNQGAPISQTTANAASNALTYTNLAVTNGGYVFYVGNFNGATVGATYSNNGAGYTEHFDQLYTTYNLTIASKSITATGTETVTVTNSNAANRYAIAVVSLNPSIDFTTAGAATAVGVSASTIDVSMPYTNDGNANNTYTVQYCLTSANCPVSGLWVTWVSGAAHTASPYTTTITGLSSATSYDVRVTYNDADGVTGTNPQTITGVTTGGIYYSTTSGNAGTLANWNTSRTGGGSPPANFIGADTFVIQNGYTMDTSTSAWTLTNAVSRVQVESGGTLTLNTNNVSAYGVQVDAGGTFNINAGRNLTVNNSTAAFDLTVNGTLVNSSTTGITLTGSAMSVGATGTYQHNVNGAAIPTATWDPASTLSVTGVTNTALTLTAAATNFGNVIWNSPSQTVESFITSANNTVIQGNLTINNTGTSQLVWAATAVTGGTITGNLAFNNTGANNARFEPFHATGGSIGIGGSYSNTSAVALGTTGIGCFHATCGGLTSTLNFTGTGKNISGALLANSTNASTINYNINGTYALSGNTAIGGTNNTSTLTIANTRSLDLDTYTMTASGGTTTFTVANGGTLLVGGATNFPTGFGTINTGVGSTVNYDGAAQTITGRAYGNLALSGTDTKTLGGATSLLGNWTNNSNLALAGNFAVTFNGAGAQAIYGNNNFYGLSVTTAAARTVSFESGHAQTVTNSLNFTGAAGQLLTLAPTTAASSWLLNFTGATQSVSYVSVSYSNASSGNSIDASNGTNTNGGNNVNWYFTSAPPPPPLPPVVSITYPANNASFQQGVTITFIGSAIVPASGDVSSGLTWSSDRDGAISSGASVGKSNLTVGTHIITASVVDSQGVTRSASITITIDPSMTDPHGAYMASTDMCAACHRTHTAGSERLINYCQSPLTSNNFCLNCHSTSSPCGTPIGPVSEKIVSTHSNIDWPGNRSSATEPVQFELLCIQCHNPHGSTNLYSVRPDIRVGKMPLNPLTMPTTGPVVFTALTGNNSFDEIDSVPPETAASNVDDICVTCHVNGSNPGAPMVNHSGGIHLAGADYRGMDCTNCHPHSLDTSATTRDGFMTGCRACHSKAQTRTSVPTAPPRRQIVGTTGGDYTRSSHHVTGNDTITDYDCQICHEMTQHKLGTVRLNNLSNPAAPYILTYTYNPPALPALPTPDQTSANAYEAFCISCHDSDGWAGDTTPFSDNKLVPAISTLWSGGTPITRHNGTFTTFLGSCVDCHNSGHGSNKLKLLAPWNFTAAAAPDAMRQEENFCFNCHNTGPGRTVFTSFNTWTNTATSIYEHDVSVDRGLDHGKEVYGSSFAIRHIECGDCHEPHEDAYTGTSTTAPAIKLPQRGASGIQPTWPATIGQPSSYSFLVQANNEYEVCFKCHSGYTTLPSYAPTNLGKLTAAAQKSETRDLATEFNPSAASFHPVTAPGKNTAINTWVATSSCGGVSPCTVNSRVFCTDCHTNANGNAAGDNGPHGSPRLHILKGTADYVTHTGGGTITHNAGEVCFLCHSYGTYVSGTGVIGTSRFTRHRSNTHNQYPCYDCHDSHGAGSNQGLVNFDASHITFGTTGRNSQTGWVRNGTGGTCYPVCHGKDHTGGETYP